MGISLIKLTACLLLGIPVQLLTHAAAPPAGGRGSAPPEIRVVLSDSKSEAELGGAITWRGAGRELGSTSAAVKVQLTPQGVKAVLGGKPVELPRLIAAPQDPQAPLSAGGRGYRGRIELFRGKSGKLVVLNVLPLEDYLLSVVPSEMPANWPQEALRAQAVAARTYALARMADQQGDTYDVYNSVADQVYAGLRGESAAATKAVRDTAGQILTWQGKPITAYFCSDAGGYTLAGKAPYLQCVPSRSTDSPYNSWSIALSQEELGKLAEQAGSPVGVVQAVQAENHPVSGHLLSLTLTGSTGTCTLKANTLRRLLGLERMRSTLVHVSAAAGGSSGSARDGTQAEAPAGARDSTAGVDAGGTDGGAVIARSGGEAVDVAVPDAPPQPRRGILAVLGPWFKPWVWGRSGSRPLKLRALIASDGRTQRYCKDEIYAQGAPERTAPPAQQPDQGAAPAKGRYGFPPPRKLPVKPAKSAPLFPPEGTPAPPDSGVLRIGAQGIVLNGSGNGHGLGMSQYGARQLAQDGKSYREILLYFYSGVQLTNWDGTLAAPAAPAATVENATPAENSSGFYRPFEPGD